MNTDLIPDSISNLVPDLVCDTIPDLIYDMISNLIIDTINGSIPEIHQDLIIFHTLTVQVMSNHHQDL